jgi:Protein of unknown function (DUF5131)
MVELASAHKQPSLEAELASIRGTVDLQPVAAGLSVKVLLGEPVERFLDRQAAVGVVHVVVDDQCHSACNFDPLPVLDRIDALRKAPAAIRFISFEPLIGSVGGADLTGIHWVIVGGESGPRARPIEPEWVDEIEAMCRAAGVAFFFKQWGGKNKKRAGRLFKGEIVEAMPAVHSSS